MWGIFAALRFRPTCLLAVVLAWFVIMSDDCRIWRQPQLLFPAKVTVTELFAEGGSFALWSTYIRYIGAGAVLTGGLIGLLESLPLIIRTFHDALGDLDRMGHQLRTEQDLSMKTLIGGILFIIAALWALPMIPLNAFGALLVAVFGFFFATVSSRMVADRIVQQPCFRNGHCYPPGFHLTAQEYGQ